MNEYRNRNTILKLYELYKNYLFIQTKERIRLINELQRLKEMSKEIETPIEQRQHIDKMFKIQRLLIEEDNKQYFIGGFLLVIRLMLGGIII